MRRTGDAAVGRGGPPHQGRLLKPCAVRQTAMPVRSIGKAKPRGWPRATTLPCILGFVVKSAPDTQRGVDREDAAQRSVSPVR